VTCLLTALAVRKTVTFRWRVRPRCARFEAGVDSHRCFCAQIVPKPTALYALDMERVCLRYQAAGSVIAFPVRAGWEQLASNAPQGSRFPLSALHRHPHAFASLRFHRLATSLRLQMLHYCSQAHQGYRLGCWGSVVYSFLAAVSSRVC
jgi:hypothetical protein